MNNAYIYVADAPLNTTDISTQSIAYSPVSSASADGNVYGLYFTLEEDKEVILAFQADIENGPNAQEFRESKVTLPSYTTDTSIDDIIDSDKVMPDFNAPATFYSITGVKLNEAPRKGLFIMRQGGNTYKIRR